MTTILLALPPETERKLRTWADAVGLTVEGYLRRLAERDIAESEPPSASTFDAVLAPIWQGFAESGMSDDELGALLDEAREEAWRERQARDAGRCR